MFKKEKNNTRHKQLSKIDDYDPQYDLTNGNGCLKWAAVALAIIVFATILLIK